MYNLPPAIRPLDSFKHKGMREQLVKTLKAKGIVDQHVLNAIGEIPRHLFLDKALEHMAYEDKALPILSGQTISQPFTVAYQTQLLQLKKRDKVLEIGTGSGYQTAVLVALGAKVFSIERQRLLYTNTHQLLKKLEVNYQAFYGDGTKGIPTYAPFDKIIVTAGAPVIPESLVQQLKPGGIMVIPVGNAEAQKMRLVVKIDETHFKEKILESFKFVPLIGESGW